MQTFLKKVYRHSTEFNGIELRLRALKMVAKVVLPEYRFKAPQIDWWIDDNFTAFLEQFRELSHENTDRKWMLHQLMRLVSNVEGDTAECGVFRGASSYLICASNEQAEVKNKVHHAFDSFEGISKPEAEHDGKHWFEGQLKCELESVKHALRKFQNVEYHAGWIPDTFHKVEDRSFSMVHIDVDLYQPTRDSIEFFFPRLSPGGILVCDDYGCRTCPGATEAIDNYLEEHSEAMIALPDGGGMLIKGTTTSDHVILPG